MSNLAAFVWELGLDKEYEWVDYELPAREVKRVLEEQAPNRHSDIWEEDQCGSDSPLF